MSRMYALAAVAVAAITLEAAEPVSYYRDVRPLLQVHCSGCHQPANAMSGLEITTYTGLLRGGAKHGSSVVQGSPDASPLLGLVTGKMEPRMPMGGAALPTEAVELLTRWVREGADDDTPVEARAPQVRSEPPTYEQAPTITGMAYSPDGTLLAVGGFQEIVLHKTDGSGIHSRLLGRSDKIHSIDFSSDGTTLVAVGGTPARFGEVQVWNLESNTPDPLRNGHVRYAVRG